MGLIILDEQKKESARAFANDVLFRGNDDAYNPAVLSLLYATEYAITQALDFGRVIVDAAEKEQAVDAFSMNGAVGGLRALRDAADKYLRLFEAKREELLEYSKHSHGAD